MGDGMRWMGTAYLTEAEKAPRACVRQVRVVTIGEAEFVEQADGSRWRTCSFDKVFDTQAEAEMYCASELERIAAPILAEASKLREEAAARVAAESVVRI